MCVLEGCDIFGGVGGSGSWDSFLVGGEGGLATEDRMGFGVGCEIIIYRFVVKVGHFVSVLSFLSPC